MDDSGPFAYDPAFDEEEDWTTTTDSLPGSDNAPPQNASYNTVVLIDIGCSIVDSADPDQAVPPLPLDNECDADDPESQIDHIVESREAPPAESRDFFLEYARKHEVDSLLQDDYSNARRYKITEDVIHEAIRIERARTDTRSWLDAIDERISRLTDRISDIETNYNDRIARLEEEFNVRRGAMEERHSEEREAFADAWSSPSVHTGFDKASPALLQLRQIMRNQALSKDFDMALMIKAEVERLQKQEQDEAQVRAVNTMRLHFMRLQEAQAHKMAVAEDHYRQLIENCTETRDKEVGPLRLAIQQLRMKKIGPTPKLLGAAITRPRSAASNIRPTSSTTKRNLSAYRTSQDQGRLYLPPFNVVEALQPCALSASQPVRPRTTKRYRSLRV
jgi:hypothetical protein